MPLEFEGGGSNSETRFDATAMQRVMRIATELQGREKETFSRVDLERIGAEIGLGPDLVHRAIRQLEAERVARQHAAEAASLKRLRFGLRLWLWVGWLIPPLLSALGTSLRSDLLMNLCFLVGLAVYIGGGIQAGEALRRRQRVQEELRCTVGR
jgi:hypothetical protein